MDALDAGAWAYAFEATVPKTIKVVLWGPLYAKQLGFESWTYQDGGETGFVHHTSGRAVRLGVATATLTVVRRMGRAHLTLYLGGYPRDAPAEQRQLDLRAIITEAELFLTRLSGETVRFTPAGEWDLMTAPTPVAVAARTTGRIQRSPVPIEEA